MRDEIVNFLSNYWKKLGITLGFILLIPAGIISIAGTNETLRQYLVYISLFLIIGISLLSFYQFYVSDKRSEHEIKNMHASMIISSFYGVFFPVILLAIFIQFILVLNARTLFSSDVSPFGNMTLIIPGLVTAFGIIAIADNSMRKKRLTYSPPGRRMRFWKSIFYGFPFIGLYFGIRLLANLLVQIFFGPGALYTSVVNPYSIDSGVIFAAKIWIFSSKIERALLPIAFLALYISIEVFLRGLMTSQVRSLKLGASGIIFIPAIVQAAAFSSGTLLFSDPILYLYRFMDAMLFGIAVGTVLWRTKRFDVALIIAIIMRFIDTGSEFFRVVMLSAPKFMGDYDLNDSTTSTIENIASSISFIQIFLIMLTPLILIVSYDEVWSIIKSIRNNFSKQWFGYIIIAFTFIVIDIIFSFFITALSFLVIVGYILALIALRFVLPFLYNRLPPMTQQLMFSTEEGLLLHEFPIDVVKDIKFLENQSPWYANPTKYAISAGLLYIYFLFIGAAYRLYGILSFMDSVKFSVFLVILPAILFSFSSYLLIDRHAKGYFFAENWRSQLNIALILLYFYNLLTWTKSGATADFVWRNVPFFLFYLLLLFPKRIDSPFRSFAIGLSRDGRYATFRWILNNPSLFKDTIHLLKDVPSDIISSGILILEAKLNLLDEGEIFSLLRGDKIRKGTRIGAILALAILKSRSAEGLLLDQLTNDDLDVKLAAFWSLGQVGNTSALAIMAKTIEENPIKELINVAEKAILRIDPMYPLAGLREQAILV